MCSQLNKKLYDNRKRGFKCMKAGVLHGALWTWPAREKDSKLPWMSPQQNQEEEKDWLHPHTLGWFDCECQWVTSIGLSITTSFILQETLISGYSAKRFGRLFWISWLWRGVGSKQLFRLPQPLHLNKPHPKSHMNCHYTCTTSHHFLPYASWTIPTLW
jgi:hypothetical protein